jgi:NDP-sugar pyrophosphorylase family protein
MKAMILAAGLGTRLRPLTDTRPKALVEINGRTLLEITISRLRAFGITEVIVNVHHFAGMVESYLKSKNNFGMRIEISREDDLLLDTGGGLKKASWFFLEDSTRHDSNKADEPFLLHNVDVISNIDLAAMLQFHNEHQALATLAVQSRDSGRQLLFNDQLQLSGRRINNKDTLIPSPPTAAIPPPNTVISSPHPTDISISPHTVISPPHTVISSEARNLSSPSTDAPGLHSPLATRHSPLPQSKEPSPLLLLAFSGIHVISPRLLTMLTEEGVFSIIDSYLRLSSQGEKILAFRHDHSYWRDLGKPADLAQAVLDIQSFPR